MSDASRVGAKLWSHCKVLRDDGLSYQDYLEQLTTLLFLKMAEERSEITGEDQPIPEGLRWGDLNKPGTTGVRLEEQYRKTLRELGKSKGMLGLIFSKAQNKIQDPAKLKQLIVELIGTETWSSMSTDVKGDAYEDLLERNAQDVKGGAGQYFTPRPVIEAIVDCVGPQPGETICDPACGTGGFLLGAYAHITANHKLNKSQKKKLKYDMLRGVELVDGVSRLCAMNLYLHGIGPDGEEREVPITTADALKKDPSTFFDIVITNPPFGRKSSITIVGDDGELDTEKVIYKREGFYETSNKQLNFVQHVMKLLKVDGRAAVVVPDNVLFEGGTGEKVRKRLLKNTDLHTILRLPTGIWYSPGVKANVMFFDAREGSDKAWTKKVWFYDLRTNKHFTLKKKRMRRADLDDFVSCYRPEDRHKRRATWSEKKPEGRWRALTYKEILERDKTSLDFSWLRDESLEDSANLPDPDVLAEEIAEDLRASLAQIEDILADLEERRAE